MTGQPDRSGPRISPGAQLRQLLDSGRLVAAPGAFDPFTAMIIESLGFPAVYLGGNAMGIHLGTGQPFVTLTEAVDCTLRAERAVRCPLIVDADAGFGDPAHTHRTVREFERARAAAIHIDDQPAPKRAHYHLGKGRVTPVGEMVGKLRVAMAARTDPDFVIIGKTDALRVHSVPETLTRCAALVETGIDMLMVVDLSPADAPVFQREFPGTPLVWIGGHRGPVPSLSEIEAGGFRLAVYPFTTLAAVAQSVRAIWTTVLEQGQPGHSEELLSQMRQHVLELVGMQTYWEIERETTERVSD
ncbi:MAG TPA: isocitrate lyase/PEP mutase family protein [Streptosporangiaceae bacterium]|nr:isocitrate lyase/PEP mutase family protein [Streptosporangiaceae bacterium]